ncbi:MAG: YlbF family regulator [Ruminococcaceae bacterium]|jgi:hypothetical protein|nr:YlbF family regulator [Oscillospiraceae bacterium]
MAELLTLEMKALVGELGELVKADPRNEAIRQAIDDYERSDELNALVAEYNAQQNALADLYATAGDKTPDEDVAKALQERIDLLYDTITSHPVYAAYMDAKKAFDSLTNGIIAELQYVITGERSCGHDCASCAGCH